MRLIVLTNSIGEKVYVNPAQVCAIYIGGMSGKTIVQFAEKNNCISVNESIDTVVEMVCGDGRK